MEVELHVFLLLSLCGGKLLASRSVRFVSERATTDVHWIGGWVGPRTGLHLVSKLKETQLKNNIWYKQW